MVRSDTGASGVMFTLDTESGFARSCSSPRSYGLGETVVQGAVNPDEFYVYKPTLRAGTPAILRRKLGEKAIKMVYAEAGAGERVVTVDVPPERRAALLADGRRSRRARAPGAERSSATTAGRWTSNGRKDGDDGKLYILQARPETVQSRAGRRPAALHAEVALDAFWRRGAASARRSARAARASSRGAHEMERVQPGDVLVADMTDPDWEPVMKRAAAIVTNRGGRTCHAAIIARELGIPAVVGCGDATTRIRDGQEVTVSCAEGDTGYVYEGALAFERRRSSSTRCRTSPVKIMMNVGNPELAFDFAGMPNDGVGLARLEFIINRMIGVHPKALLEFDRLDARAARARSASRSRAMPIRSSSTSTKIARRRRADRGGVRARAGHRAPVGLQVQRVCEPDRRPRVRAARGESDARLPRRFALHRSEFHAASSSSAARCARARRHGVHQRQMMVPFVRTLERSAAGHGAAGGEWAASAARTGCG